METSVLLLNIAVSNFGKLVRTIEGCKYFTVHLMYITFDIFDLDIHPDDRSSQGLNKSGASDRRAIKIFAVAPSVFGSSLWNLLRHSPGSWNFEVDCKIFEIFLQPWIYIKVQFVLHRKIAKFSQLLPLKEVCISWCSLCESLETQKGSLWENEALYSEKPMVHCPCSNHSALSR